MKTFKVNVYMLYRATDVTDVDVEAETEEEAKEKAIELIKRGEIDVEWDACKGSDYDYEAEIIEELADE